MTTPLGQGLILKLNRSSPSPLQFHHRPLNIYHVTKTGVCINNDRNGNTCRELRKLPGQVREGQQANIWQGKHAGRKRSAGEVTCLETGFLDHAARQRMVCPGYLNGTRLGCLA